MTIGMTYPEYAAKVKKEIENGTLSRKKLNSRVANAKANYGVSRSQFITDIDWHHQADTGPITDYMEKTKSVSLAKVQKPKAKKTTITINQTRLETLDMLSRSLKVSLSNRKILLTMVSEAKKG